MAVVRRQNVTGSVVAAVAIGRAAACRRVHTSVCVVRSYCTVNADRRHFDSGAKHLSEIEARWPGLLSRVITSRLPMERFAEGFQRSPGHVKTVVEVLPEGPSAQSR